MQHLRHPERIFFLAAVIIISLLIAVYRPFQLSATVQPPDTGSEVIPQYPDEEQDVLKAAPLILTSSVHTLNFGRTFSSLLEKAGLTGIEAMEVSLVLDGVLDMRRIKAGQEVVVSSAISGEIREIRVPVNFDRIIVAEKNEGTWSVEDIRIDVHPVPTLISFDVDSSLYQAAKDSGLPLSVMMEAISLFSFEVDFQRDIQKGNRVTLLYEKLLNDSDIALAAGELLYAGLDLEKRSIDAWRYERLDGVTDYYEASGDSVRKSLLKTPVDGARITSGFGYRNHPILGFGAVHRGIDFAVATGTPVMASGAGTVIKAGWHEQYGNMVKIRHANHYDTLYGHFSSIARGIRAGVVVEQGQVVGYVGSTGMSTGPHCHYEVLYYGSPVNPSSLKFPPGHKLDADDQYLFNMERGFLRNEYGF